MSQETAITIYPSVWKLLLLLIGATPILVLFLGVFAFLGVYVAGSGELLEFAVVGSGLFIVFGLLLFGVYVVYLAYRLLVRRPVLVIDAAGIMVHWAPMPVGLIRWADIESVGAYNLGLGRSLGLVLRDREAVMRRQPRLRRWLLALLALGSRDEPPVNIGQVILPTDVDTLAAQIKTDYGAKFGGPAPRPVPLRGPQELVPFESCRIEYALTRRQRLVAHLGVWALWLPPLVILTGGISALIIALSVAVSPWIAPVLVLPLWLARRFISGLLNVLFVRLQHVDMVIEEDGLRYDTEGGFWTYGVAGDFTGIAQLHKYSRDTWTILSGRGFVVSIPVDAIEQRYIDHIRAKAGLGTL